MKNFLAVVLVATVAVSFSPCFRQHLSRGVYDLMSWRSTDTITLNDKYLNKAVDIRWDENGDSHINASCLSDLFFGQGFVHALDRLWQLETRRSLARGTLAEKFGKKAVTLDVFSRTLGFERLARTYLDDLHSSAEDDELKTFKAYAAGINAGVESLSFLPLEFQLARVEWREWDTVDSVSFGMFMQFSLQHGWEQEGLVIALRDIVGEEGLPFLGYGEEKGNSYTVPTAPQNWTFFTEEKEEKEKGRGKKVVEKVKKSVKKEGRKVRGGEEEKEVEELVNKIGVMKGGSNAWVVSGEYTETGKPHVANDPHLEVTFPNVWYHMYLSCPELSITGVSAPGLPVIMIGHNEYIGWGITISTTDSSDLFEEKIDKEKGVYEFQGEERELEKEIISFPVKGEEDHTFTRYSTHHGPIVTDVMPGLVFGEEEKEYSLSSSALKITGSIEAMYRVQFAKNFEEFRTALSLHVAHLNFVYGDVEGNIGFQLSGKIPVRKNKDSHAGFYLAKGWTGEDEWEGYMPFNDLPRSYNPKEGFIVSANSYPAGEWFPHHLGKTYGSNARARRIEEVLSATIKNGDKITMDLSRELQLDIVDVYARDTLPHLLPLLKECPTPACLEIYQHMVNWDSRLAKDSVAATFWAVFKQQFLSLVLEDKGINGRLREFALGKELHPLTPISATAIIGKSFAEIIKNQQASFVTSYSSLVLNAANQTITYCEQQWGEDRGEDGKRMGEKWKWGQVHTFRWPHPFDNLPVIGGIFDLGTYPFPGAAETILMASSKYETYQANAFIPSYRCIVDFSNIEKSKFLNPPGQSGLPLHEHADDMVELFLNGGLLDEKHF